MGALSSFCIDIHLYGRRSCGVVGWVEPLNLLLSVPWGGQKLS
jgi:hypothetical protein